MAHVVRRLIAGTAVLQGCLICPRIQIILETDMAHPACMQTTVCKGCACMMPSGYARSSSGICACALSQSSFEPRLSRRRHAGQRCTLPAWSGRTRTLQLETAGRAALPLPVRPLLSSLFCMSMAHDEAG